MLHKLIERKKQWLEKASSERQKQAEKIEINILEKFIENTEAKQREFLQIIEIQNKNIKRLEETKMKLEAMLFIYGATATEIILQGEKTLQELIFELKELKQTNKIILTENLKKLWQKNQNKKPNEQTA
jgi:ribosome biogenesis protein Nip4